MYTRKVRHALFSFTDLLFPRAAGPYERVMNLVALRMVYWTRACYSFSRTMRIQVNRDLAVRVLVAILDGLLDGRNTWVFHDTLVR